MDPTPVFPQEVTQKLDESLIKARAATQRYPPPLQAQRNTSTPPQNMPRYATPQQPPQQYQKGYSSHQPTPPPGATPTIDADFARRILAGLGQKQDDLPKLKEDTKNLISHTQSEFAKNPFDQSTQARLKALLQLSNILDTQQLSPEAIAQIKAQVSSLSAGIRPASVQPSTPLPLPGQNGGWQAPTPVIPAPAQQYRAPSVQPTPPVAAPSFSLGALDGLARSLAAGQKPSTPQIQAAMPALQNLPLSTQSPVRSLAMPAGLPQGNAIIDQLRAAGIIPNNISTPSQPPLPPPSAPPTQLPNPADLSRLLSNMPALASLPRPPPLSGPGKPRLPLSQAGLKPFNPSLLSSLYDPQSNPCSTCGRRFASTPAGSAQKAGHLDWHFRTNQKIADATHRSQHRSWYPDEHEWIKTRDIDPSSGIADTADEITGTEDSGPAKTSLPVPTELGVNKECPICQDEFKQDYDKENQEWVWLDAVRPEPRGKVYHASCHEEVARNRNGGAGSHFRNLSGGSGRERSGTPESRKRKAEDVLGGKGKGIRTG